MATPTDKRIQHCPITINKPPSLLHQLTHRGLKVLTRSISSMGLLKELKMSSPTASGKTKSGLTVAGRNPRTTEVFPIEKALEISVPSSLASQLNWFVESDSVSSQPWRMLGLFNSISINDNSENSGLSSRFERGKLRHAISKAELDFIASLTTSCSVFLLYLFPLFQPLT
ncbi:hypothetical protein NC653_007989 [Populus alba x Populus x berolinensis]|uniref:Uncharacterized protein n=1 Tax=Populus alba x Populus x berolinensis TaxID=444605 RepID=A0AAD6R6F7_9ROSI|nr:hypothetical protein NC653_007989 [Populus alba x Populus x berolinensis]